MPPRDGRYAQALSWESAHWCFPGLGISCWPGTVICGWRDVMGCKAAAAAAAAAAESGEAAAEFGGTGDGNDGQGG